MEKIILIAVFGGLGCLGRYYISGWVYNLTSRNFPYGTMAANVLGAFIIGFLMEFSMRSTLVSPNLRAGLTIGFLGGLTTFSTFSYETFRLIEGNQVLPATINIMVSILTCLFFVWAGITLARHI